MTRLLPRQLLLAAALCLCGCAARDVTPIAMAQPGDEDLSCTALNQQIADNTVAETEFRRKDKQTENGNIAKGVGSAIPYVGLLVAATTDLSNADQVKARALADRIERLQNLTKQKGCMK